MLKGSVQGINTPFIFVAVTKLLEDGTTAKIVQLLFDKVGEQLQKQPGYGKNYIFLVTGFGTDLFSP